MQDRFLALILTSSMTLSTFSSFLETQLLIHTMGIINVPYHKGCGDEQKRQCMSRALMLGAEHILHKCQY